MPVLNLKKGMCEMDSASECNIPYNWLLGESWIFHNLHLTVMLNANLVVYIYG